jgi:hypothetical protein
MRSLAAFLALTLPAFAETGPPTPDELARAKADCATEVQSACLFTLAVETARTSPDAELLLNEIAYAQAVSGDRAGAEQTLSLTTPGFLALAALGRVEEAQKVFETDFNGFGNISFSEPAPPNPGKVALDAVKEFLRNGQADQALSTALALPKGERIKQSEALRLIVDHHLARREFAAAAQAALQIDASFDDRSASLSLGWGLPFVDDRTDALVAVVKAQVAAGDLDSAARLVSGLIDPRTTVRARIALAEGYFRAGKAENAKLELAQVLATVQRFDLPYHFGLAELTASADLAWRHGETDIAREHARFAYENLAKTTVRRGGENKQFPPPRADLVRLATVLQLAGLTGKGKALFAQAAKPYDAYAMASAGHAASLVVRLVRLGDPAAQDMITGLLDDQDPIVSDSLRALHMAALELVDLGLVDQALAIADRLEVRLRDDSFGFEGHNPAEIYTALLLRDPDLAPQILTDRLGPRSHNAVSLALATALHAEGRHPYARAVLQALAAEERLASQPASAGQKTAPVCALRSLAAAQESLGYTEDAAATRQKALTIALSEEDTTLRSFGLLILAASFPDREAASFSVGFSCVEYP